MFIRVERAAKPDPETRKKYKKIMPVFVKSYRALTEVDEDLAELSWTRPSAEEFLGIRTLTPSP